MNTYQFNYRDITGRMMVRLVKKATLEEAVKELKMFALPNTIELVYVNGVEQGLVKIK